ncbi:MAG: ATP-binding cassette domain-containing protein [Verrucomicrobiota bacterium]|nr:ABC transporter ATP-binding protein [Verrucomicrobiales bacterium]MEE2942190.1 ATP-binding cassette domain-containing protein [Verrucomicrobiota bacterium]|tara:strand:+ start:3467 stop:4213 length:747 start_codon:yes stop_codon:yes gene_type:complete
MIEVIQLHKHFGQQHVLRGVDLRIEEGESVVIIGGSGCGKSVLLRHIIGLVSSDSGDVKINGQSIVGLPERELIKVRRKFGMLFQGAALFDSLTVEENVGFLLEREQTMSPSAIREIVAEALELVDLSGTQAKKPAELSGGMKKRVGLARAIVYKPEIILYDEPTTGLDPVVADSIDQLVVKMRDQLNCTSIVVTHDTRSMRRVGNRVMMLHNGVIHANDVPEEIFKSTDPVVHKFVNGIADPKDLEF